jgi:hypothetical protein
MLEKVRNALRISVSDNEAINDELTDLIEAAKMDLGIAGVIVPDEFDALVSKAVITYCKLSFGLPEDYDRLKRSYDEQKAQLMTATGYTDWGGGACDV